MDVVSESSLCGIAFFSYGQQGVTAPICTKSWTVKKNEAADLLICDLLTSFNTFVMHYVSGSHLKEHNIKKLMYKG